jgi:hypothetical protein
MGTIANKATTKLMWDPLLLWNVGAERVHKVWASTLRQEFDSLAFEDGKTVDDFAVRMTRLTMHLAVFGSSYTNEEIIRCFL